MQSISQFRNFVKETYQKGADFASEAKGKYKKIWNDAGNFEKALIITGLALFILMFATAVAGAITLAILGSKFLAGACGVIALITGAIALSGLIGTARDPV